MITYSIIKKSELEGTKRLDAEYYQLEYFAFLKQISKFNKNLLSDIAIIRSGTTPKNRDDDLKNGVILLKTTDIRNNTLDLKDDYYFVSKEINERMNSTKLLPRDILINIVGATLDVIGRSAYVPINFPVANITQAMALIRLRDKNFLPEYIFTFLLSKYGRFQANRLARPTGQYNLNLEELRSFQIPKLEEKDQTIIKDFVENSIKEKQFSEILYSQAEKLLLEELGLKNFEKEVERNLYSVVNFSEIKKVNRIDAEYFQPKYEKLFSKLRKNNPRSLGELVTMKKGIEPGSEAYQEEGKLFIRVSSLSKNGITDKDEKYLSNKLYENLKENFQPKQGEILLTKDATPGVAYVLKEGIEGIVSGGILRLKLKEKIDPEYLALCINSVAGQFQVERDAGGSVIAHWKSDQVKQMLIPILPEKIQQEISNLVRQSHEARKKSKELLEEAKRKVEELIESKSK